MEVLGQGPRGDIPPRIQTRNRHENTLSCTGGQGKAKLATVGPSAFGRHSSPNTGEGWSRAQGRRVKRQRLLGKSSGGSYADLKCARSGSVNPLLETTPSKVKMSELIQK